MKSKNQGKKRYSHVGLGKDVIAGHKRRVRLELESQLADFRKAKFNEKQKKKGIEIGVSDEKMNAFLEKQRRNVVDLSKVKDISVLFEKDKEKEEKE